MRCFRHGRRHLDEVYGETHYLWRAVDHEGEILESYVTKTPDKKAALRFRKKAMKELGNSAGMSSSMTLDGEMMPAIGHNHFSGDVACPLKAQEHHRVSNMLCRSRLFYRPGSLRTL